MAEPLLWLDDGTPASARFGDRYHSRAGHGLPQARGTFLAGCELPQAWAGRAQWHVLETGFGLGLNFLVTWDAWRKDPARPRLLHFSSCEAWPVGPEALLRAAPPEPALQALAAELAAQYQGMTPGVHRLVFEHGRVLLTILVGDVQRMLRAQRLQADCVYLDGFAPRLNPQMWSEHTLKAVARSCRRGARIATWCTARSVRETLARCGFALHTTAGVAPKRENLRGSYEPPWQPHPVRAALPAATLPPGRRCAVVGAGLAGAAVANSLARRGWRVTVHERGAGAASGASGVPAAIAAPHASPDDSLISRLSRAGLRALRLALQQHAGDLQGRDWALDGVLEHRVGESAGLPGDSPEWRHWSVPADAAQCAQTTLAAPASALWHSGAGWLRPQALIERLLAQPGVALRTHSDVARIEAAGGPGTRWRLLDARGRLLDEADLLVVCAGAASGALSPAAAALPLQPVRGMCSLGPRTRADGDTPWPSQPVNGHGMLIPGPVGNAAPYWVCGSTFERGQERLPLTPAEIAAGHEANFAKLSLLLPGLAPALAPRFLDGGATLSFWSGVRCGLPDHLPLVGPLDAARQPGLWLCTGLGARGATLASLCAELLAARLHGEPLPLDAALARALMSERFAPATQPACAYTDA
ncbi:FAD-dependent 5-carboxymethylaminomethyl-2-thiouridine(34) oxidoreductase MnmC [Comamonas sp. NLF-1-9]|uniref:FAD-dependent 5-carboxymethylaminomethyl-2-thiouridine(34) oxidoreductase MnmC n=1 Tax=Comamonas sp. NLF-1-9 TaxID=2853163 RepID=UPI001C479EEA|nr:FAD-dependent 5-carboxymethylaminomethyl-2-thiouridine(34) oxidoreductase MnmC [Comamonas sp. NLF-1-9]QXL84871.1 FAD-dependent 5-carboxymethylaminomethyl-2-thiouridine(34) oxidoreductase MnmC [Comamonas sp. NLF-1-9]